MLLFSLVRPPRQSRKNEGICNKFAELQKLRSDRCRCLLILYDCDRCFVFRLQSSDRSLQGIHAVGVLPLHAQILAAHVTIGGQLAVDGLAQDGYLEIPTATLMPGYRELQEGERLYQVTFCSMEDGALVEKQTAAVNLSQGYMIRYPDSWNGRVTVIVQHETGEWIFVAYDGSLENSREVLLKMRVYSQNDYRDPFDMENYRLIDRKGMFEYYAYIPPEKNSRLAITYDQLEQELFQRL